MVFLASSIRHFKRVILKFIINAVEAITTLNIYEEGKLEVIKLREDKDSTSDGKIKVFF